MKALLKQPNMAACGDPLIRYLRIRFIQLERQNAWFNGPSFRDAAAAMDASQYPDIRKFYPHLWAAREFLEAQATLQDARVQLEAAAKALVKGLADESMPVPAAEAACEGLLALPTLDETRLWEVYAILAPALDTGRWRGTAAALLTKARAYRIRAWMARGNGVASTVSETGGRLFSEYLEIAADSLERAWRNDPHDVGICIEMLRVELGQGQGRDRMELWFNRGMKLDPANLVLCGGKLWYLNPRWYGSKPEMLAFGRECTMNTNWSGRVRLLLADAHDALADEIGDEEGKAEYWRQPAVWRDIQMTFEQYFRLYPGEKDYRQNYAAYAAKCGQWQVFLDEAKSFSKTNYAIFGGEQRYRELEKDALAHIKQP